MKYKEVTVFTTNFGVEPVIGILDNLGITQVAVENPGDIEELCRTGKNHTWDYIDEELLAGLSSEAKVRFYIEDGPLGDKLLFSVKYEIMALKNKEYEGLFGEENSLGRLYVEARVTDDSEWKDNWKKHFKTLKLTEKITVKPPWDDYEGESPEEKVIVIDPGMAFGTGSHETTALCVELMEKYIEKGATVLDVGCGSGILSIAANYLGGGEVLGVEIDRDAVENAMRNTKRNCPKGVAIRQGDLLEGITVSYDLIVANLFAGLIEEMAQRVAESLKETGLFIASGILAEQGEKVGEALELAGLKVIENRQKGEWCALVARKKI